MKQRKQGGNKNTKNTRSMKETQRRHEKQGGINCADKLWEYGEHTEGKK